MYRTGVCLKNDTLTLFLKKDITCENEMANTVFAISFGHT